MSKVNLASLVMAGRSKGVIPVVNQGRCWICPDLPKYRGYCDKHYRELLRSGELTSARTLKPLGQCKDPDCKRQATRNFADYCQRCYLRRTRRKKMAERLASGDIPANVGRRGKAGIQEILEMGE